MLSIAVEDAPNGVRSAVAAGIPTIYIPDQNDDSAEIGDLYYKKLNDLSEDKNDALRMQAYSFVTKPDDNVTDLSDIIAGNRNDNSGNIKYLWLNRKNEVNNRYCYKGDTEYLKEINLGSRI